MHEEYEDCNWSEANGSKQLRIMTSVVLSSDPSVTPHNVIPVFRALTGDWDIYIIVPDARAQVFRGKLTTCDELTEAAGKYVALYHHNPSWRRLSVSLYKGGETESLQIARPHIQTVRGM